MNDQPQEADRLFGKLISDRYRIQRKIGEGGMGTVYEAVHEAIEKKIALKVLHARYSSSPEVVRRFKQEAISASRIKHQNVIDVFDFGQLGDGSCFIAMEFLEGVDLGASLEKRRHFSPEEAIRIAAQMCRALGLGHERGVVHRDLKPENVFLQVTPDGDEIVKIVDFGIAQLKSNEPETHEVRPRRLTKTGMIFGTPEYMSPEQARGSATDERSDIYATGVILYELLTGAVPFLGESFLEVLNQHVQSRVPQFSQANPDIDVSPELERAVMRALEKDPEDRYPSMKDFATALFKTPEGRRADARSASVEARDDAGNESARIENSRYPKPIAGGGTAMFGSSGEAPDFDPDAPPDLSTDSSRGLTLFVGFLLLVVLGVVGYFILGRTTKNPTPARADVMTQKSAGAEQKKASSPAAEATPTEPNPRAPSEDPKPTQIALQIRSEPTGALIKKGGFQVCTAAPCELLVEPGEAVTLSAELGASRGEAKVLAQKNQDVFIQLVAPRSAPRPRPAPAALPSPKPALCEVMVDGIKILRPCE